MNNKKSFASQRDHNALEVSRTDEKNFVLDVYIQMIIDEALYNYKKNLLKKQINEALDARDRNQFYHLTEQYKELIKMEV
ncbi:IDEAL domain-containing protein [Calidifontibacillus erzurumensis]|uniref:IDEAL domain-containing protein n=1 Tax=Calidifontibacillus erzurumensis TaxID=2741433 RepID=A0A8J8GGR7_9BACI|nr:IDEAL domain-containing protein [Calidifontibacillus erzurumensis]NSL52025.1 IDEAL domain-containing protein [Calidifontibacillus erzurumensis]